MSTIHNINCPNCNHQFDVEDVLAKKLEKGLKQELLAKELELKDKYNKQLKNLEEKEEAFENKRQQENKLFKEKLKKALDEERGGLKKEIYEEFEMKIKSAEEALNLKKTQVHELREKELALLKREAKIKEEKDALKLDLEKQLLMRQKEIEEKAQLKERERYEMEKIQLNKQLEDQKKLIDEMKRKAEQGSMQMQGEVQELAIEDALRTQFPFDIIEEVAKGIRGADSIHTVINSNQNACGKIIYESKRTKNFSNDWIEKLKADQINCGADIAVLVSESLPKQMNKFGKMDGVWVCNYQDFLPLASVLRQLLINVYSAKSAEENKGDKMELMYKFVTSAEFVQRIKAIVEGFSNMKQELDREKRAMQNLWKKREKQIDLVIENTVSLHGSIEGIAGQAFPKLEILDLDEPENHVLIQ